MNSITRAFIPFVKNDVNKFIKYADKKAGESLKVNKPVNIISLPKNEDCLVEEPQDAENKAYVYKAKERAPRERKGITPEEIQAAKDTVEGAKKMFETFIKCVRIALKIVAGDNVPPQDDKFLSENEPEMHSNAWKMRSIKSDPEDHESELEEEENEETLNMGSGTAKISFGGEGSDINMTVERLDITV